MKFKAGDILIHNNGEMKVQVLRIFKDSYDLRIIEGFSKKIIKAKCNESKYSSRQVWISNQSIQLVCE
jgi:hypothetical protein